MSGLIHFVTDSFIHKYIGFSGKKSILIFYLAYTDYFLICKALELLDEEFSCWESEKQRAFSTRSSACGAVRLDIPEF